MKFVLFKCSFISLTVLEILCPFAIKHAVMPVTFIFAMSSLSVKYSPSTLHSVSKISFIPTTIRPPESTFAVSFSCFELSLINITLFTSPSINSSSLLFIKSKLAYIVISSCEIKFSLALKLPIMELSMYDFMCIFKEANTFAMRTINFGLSDINNFSVLEKFRSVESWFCSKYDW